MESEYKQHMRKFLEHLRGALVELDRAAATYKDRGPGPLAYTEREMEAEAMRLEDQIVALERMLSAR